jgi:hypothetical protein
VGAGCCHPGAKRPEREADHLPSSSRPIKSLIRLRGVVHGHRDILPSSIKFNSVRNTEIRLCCLKSIFWTFVKNVCEWDISRFRAISRD